MLCSLFDLQNNNGLKFILLFGVFNNIINKPVKILINLIFVLQNYIIKHLNVITFLNNIGNCLDLCIWSILFVLYNYTLYFYIVLLEKQGNKQSGKIKPLSFNKYFC